MDVDMKPVVAALEVLGLSREEICEVSSSVPNPGPSSRLVTQS